MKDKVVVITGATSGIGKALAFAFGERGSKIFITGRNREALDQTVSELQQKQIIVRGCLADAALEGDNEQMVKNVIDAFEVSMYLYAMPVSVCAHCLKISGWKHSEG